MPAVKKCRFSVYRGDKMILLNVGGNERVKARRNRIVYITAARAGAYENFPYGFITLNVTHRAAQPFLYKRGEKYILHRIIKVHPDDYVIVGDNCIWREYGIKDDQILGVMTRVVRDGKSITTDNILYKIYVHLWVDLYYVRATILYCKILLHSIKHKIKRLLTQ